MKKFAVFIFFISFFLFSCGKQNVKKDAEIENTGSHKEELIIGSAVDINNLNLLKQADQINNICLKLTHQTLFILMRKTAVFLLLQPKRNGLTTIPLKLRSSIMPVFRTAHL
ncbi:MAG: hypothetical protein ACFNX1_02995 [Treponema lecithinolyticum]|uniref:hypothetical protein n=1 Tax=Treponema lecithinolyticum TaxID=53418 RepID=UPI003622DCB7